MAFQCEIVMAEQSTEEGLQLRSAGGKSFLRVGGQGSIVDEQFELVVGKLERVTVREPSFE